MEAKKKAEYLIAVFSLAVLSQMGHELDMDKVNIYDCDFDSIEGTILDSCVGR
jgi:hypothetical protein